MDRKDYNGPRAEADRLGAMDPAEFKDIRSLAEALRAYSRAAAAADDYEARAARQAAAAPPAYTAPPHAGQPARQRPGKRPLSEAAIGKYAFTVLASVLILGAAAVFLALLWPAMPDAAKYLVLLATGGGLEVSGAYRARNRAMRPFWLGVSALGSGILFLDVAVGGTLFGLYGTVLSGALVFCWCGLAFALGRRAAPMAGAWVYDLTAYAGACMSAVLAGAAYGPDGLSTWISAVLAGCVGLAGYMNYRRSGRAWRCWAMAVYSQAAAAALYFFQYGHGDNPTAALCAGALCAAGLLALSRKCMDGNFFPQLLAYTAQACALSQYLAEWAGDGAGHAFSLLAMAAILIGANGWYPMGIAAPAFIACGYVMSAMAGPLPAAWSPWPYLIGPALGLAAMGLALSKGQKRWRAAGAAFWLANAWAALHISGITALPAAVLVIILLCGVAAYGGTCGYRNCWFDEPWDKLLLHALPGVFLEPLVAAGVLPRPVPALAALAGLYLYFNNEMMGKEPDIRLEYVWRGARAAAFSGMAAYAVPLASLIYDPGGLPDMLTVTLGMAMALGFNVYLLALSRDGKAGIWACLLANLELYWLFSMWGLGRGTVLSVLGILLAAACLYGGFRFRLKRLRLGGLAGAFAWSLKLGLADAANGTAAGAAGGLLIAGLVCLGMSLAYNRLGRMLEQEAPGPEAGDGKDGT